MADFADEVRRLMAERGMSLHALARAANYDVSYLSKVLNGHKPASPHVAKILDDTLSAGGAIREATVNAPALEVLKAAERVRLGLDDVLGTGMMAQAGLDDWDRTVARYGYATRDRPSAVLLGDLCADLQELKLAIGRHRSASALRRLTLVTAQMSGMVCLTLVKMGDRKAFRQWARTARTAAAEAGDLVTVAWVLAQEAYGHYYVGDLVEAVAIARGAQDAAGGTPCVGAVLAAALEMRAHAAMGAASETAIALAEAERILGRLSSREQAASAFGYRESQLRFHEGSAYTHLHDIRAAVRAQDRALELCPAADYTDWAMTRLDRAACVAYQGDMSGAISYATETLLGLDSLRRKGIITSRGHEFLADLPPSQRSGADARDLRELLMLTTDRKEIMP